MHISRIGGGYFGESQLQSGIDVVASDKPRPRNATWPFAKLKLMEENLEVSILGNSQTLRYSDIDRISVKKSGFIHVHAKSSEHSFGFSCAHIRPLLDFLQKRGVRFDESCQRNVVAANTVNLMQVIIVPCIIVAFVAVIVLFFVHGPHLKK